MSNRFDISLSSDDSLVPHWVLAVVRLKYQASISHIDFKNLQAPWFGADERGKPLVIQSDCIQLNISAPKGSHVKSLGATLKQGANNYLLEILPGDWVMAWIVNSEEKAADIVTRIRQGSPVNEFDDGLKFVGRAQSIRKKLTQDTNSGRRIVSYSLGAVAFNELNTMMFRDANLESADNSIGKWLARMNLDENGVFLIEAKEGGGAVVSDNGHKLIPLFVNILLGSGLPHSSAGVVGVVDEKPVDIQQITGSVQSKEAPFAYIVPASVGRMLGRSTPSKNGGIISYADMMNMLIGIQSYPNNQLKSQGTKWATLVPDLNDQYGIQVPLLKARENREYTTHPALLGAFWPANLDFMNKPLWSLLQQFLNPHINEMYTCMRVNKQGRIYPTLVLRQMPFTTPMWRDKSITTTSFMDVPRWVLGGARVTGVDVGRSDVARVNFVHVYGQDSYAGDNVALYKQIVTNPPIRDDLDIQRSGLRPLMGTVACKLSDLFGQAPTTWIRLVSDFNMGNHLMLNGTILCHGIEEPIAEGDNVEWDDAVYQIEQVDHSCSMNTEGGQRSWITSLSLTHGMTADAKNVNNVNMYPGMPGGSENDPNGSAPLTGYDPQISYDGSDLEDRSDPQTDTIRGPTVVDDDLGTGKNRA